MLNKEILLEKLNKEIKCNNKPHKIQELENNEVSIIINHTFYDDNNFFNCEFILDSDDLSKSEDSIVKEIKEKINSKLVEDHAIACKLMISGFEKTTKTNTVRSFLKSFEKENNLTVSFESIIIANKMITNKLVEESGN